MALPWLIIILGDESITNVGKATVADAAASTASAADAGASTAAVDDAPVSTATATDDP